MKRVVVKEKGEEEALKAPDGRAVTQEWGGWDSWGLRCAHAFLGGGILSHEGAWKVSVRVGSWGGVEVKIVGLRKWEVLRVGWWKCSSPNIQLWKLCRMTAGLGVEKRMAWGQSIPWLGMWTWELCRWQPQDEWNGWITETLRKIGSSVREWPGAWWSSPPFSLLLQMNSDLSWFC